MISPEEIRKQNQRTIILLLLAFILPVVAAYIVYKNMDHAGKTRNNGTLVLPARPLDKLQLTGLDKAAFTVEQLKGNWHLIYLGKGPCNQVCLDSLSKMHQTRLAQGKAMSRVRLLYIVADMSKTGGMEKLSNDYARLSIVTGNKTTIDGVIKLFQTPHSPAVMESHQIYMVDPLGNLMMQYSREVPLIGLIKDLEHLLKISQIG